MEPQYYPAADSGRSTSDDLYFVSTAAGVELLAKDSVRLKLALQYLGDGYTLIIAAVVGADEHLVASVALVLHHKLLVRPIHIELHLVLSVHLYTRQPGIAVAMPHLQGQPVLGIIHYHSGHLGIHSPQAQSTSLR